MTMNYIFKQVKLYALLVALTINTITNIKAQQTTTTGLSPEVMAWTISTLEPWPEDKYKSLKEAMIDNKIFIPLVFRGGIFPEIDFKYSRDSIRLTDAPPLPPVLKIESEPLFREYRFKKSLDDLVYKEVMLKNPKYFKYSRNQLPTTVIKPESIETTKDFVKLDLTSTTPPPKQVNNVLKFIPDRKYWTSTFAADVKFANNRTSPNWHKGEINNMNLSVYTNTTYNYARDNVSLTNVLLTNFTIVNAPKDTLRRFTIGTDELRFRSNLQLKAIRKWNYSTSAEFITSMGNKYIVNKQIKNAAFLSPFTVNVGVGMTYAVKPAFKKPDRSFDLSLSLEPLSFKYMYSVDKNINLAAYFPKDEEGNYLHSLKTFGSSITMTSTTKFNKSISLFTRFYYFTNYERIQGELENKLDLILSRYFSTTIHIYLRYDDGVKKAEGSDSYLQVNELFAFGFSYRW